MEKGTSVIAGMWEAFGLGLYVWNAAKLGRIYVRQSRTAISGWTCRICGYRKKKLR